MNALQIIITLFISSNLAHMTVQLDRRQITQNTQTLQKLVVVANKATQKNTNTRETSKS